jgi:hypothetical protein
MWKKYRAIKCSKKLMCIYVFCGVFSHVMCMTPIFLIRVRSYWIRKNHGSVSRVASMYCMVNFPCQLFTIEEIHMISWIMF